MVAKNIFVNDRALPNGSYHDSNKTTIRFDLPDGSVWAEVVQAIAGGFTIRIHTGVSQRLSVRPLKAGELYIDLVSEPKLNATVPNQLSQAIAEFERALLVKTLKACRGVINLTAKRMGISRKTVWSRMKKYNIREDEWMDA